jgi:hypothetical protein
MNIALDRLIEGIVATLRSDVIPNVSDAYARGQAVGVIDLLNNIAPRIEWAQRPIHEAVAEKRALLAEIARLAPAAAPDVPADIGASTAEDLLAQRSALDARIGDAIAALSKVKRDDAGAEALALVRRHLHDEQTREMKITSKPLFAEIASGNGGGPKT